MDITAARAALVGVWRLQSYADRDTADEPWVKTFGGAPRGLLLYHHTGLLSVQLVADRGSDDAPWSYIGYIGTFEVRDAERSGDGFAGVVLHRMDVAEPRELLDEGPEREFQVRGDALLLGDGLTASRVFERVT